MIDWASVGNRIRRRRRWLELTQETLAEMVGLSTSFIGHIERSSRIPSAETLVTICSALKISVDEIIAGE